MSNPSPTVEVYPSTRASNAQVASCTVRVETNLGLVVIHDCRILRNKQGIAWFSLPSFSIQAGNRSFEYRPSLEIPPDLLQLITTEALRAYNAYQQTNETKTQPQGASSSVQHPRS